MRAIGPYELLGALGQGGAAAVYRARDTRSGEEVAIKLLREGAMAAPTAKQRFEREARALSQVEHPGVVRLRDLGEHGGALYLVLDLHEEGTLAQRMKRSLLEPREAVALGLELASALAAAHALGVLHRDLKPANVLINAGGRAVVTDFGLAKDLQRLGSTEALTRTGTILGTPGFCPPELIGGEGAHVGPEADVYGLGAVLYAGLSGHAPVEGDSLIEVAALTARRGARPIRSLRSDVPKDLERVVMRCLEREPAARWANMRELTTALRGLGASGRASPLRSAGWPLAVSTALLLGGVALAATVTLQGGPSPPPASGPPPLGASAPLSGSPPEPVASLQERAERGDVLAMRELGTAHFRGAGGGERDLRLALRWLRPAAEAGDVPSMAELGALLIESDPPGARKWLRRAADHGHASAMNNLGVLYLMGKAAPRSEADALEWFRRAAEAGNASAMHSLGKLLGSAQTIPRDAAQAVQWFVRGAKAGSLACAFAAGEAYFSGVGVPVDLQRAADYVCSAAERGNADAQFRLGAMLRQGQGVARDEGRARISYQRAAEQGHARAAYNLAIMLTLGAGGPADEEAGLRWFRFAAKSGHPVAMGALGNVLRRRASEKEVSEAREWLERGAKLGDGGSMLGLAEVYLHGVGVKRDAARGNLWLRRAAACSSPRHAAKAEQRLQQLEARRGE